MEQEAQRQRLEMALARSRTELAHSLTQLRAALRRDLRWQHWVATYPMAALGIAFAIGFLIGRR